MRDRLRLVTLFFHTLHSMKRTTIKDLAKLLNLSTSTVSRALSDHPDISEATKKRVREIAAEFNYTTNLRAQFFRKKRSGLIALILPEINMFFTPNLIKSINKTIAISNYSLIVSLSNDRLKNEKEIIRQCMGWAVEGVLISLSKYTSDLSHLEPLAKSEIHCVLLDKTINNQFFSSVTIDNVEASYIAVTYLIKKGHRNILGIFGNTNINISRDRIKGYCKALKEYNIPILKENIVSVDKDADLDYILPPILTYNKRISAVFTMSDELLSKTLYHLNALGFSIPKDLSVISISDGVFPTRVHPQITHVRDSGSKMGRTAAKLLLNLIDPTSKMENSKSNHIVSIKLIEQASVIRGDF